MRCTTHGLTVYAGVWLRATETEVNASHPVSLGVLFVPYLLPVPSGHFSSPNTPHNFVSEVLAHML